MKKISIVVVNWNGKNDSIALLNSLSTIEHQGFNLEIIVVDNHSTDGSQNELMSCFPSVKILLNSENLGFAQGNNLGIILALKNNSDYVLLLNNDTLTDKNFLQYLFETAEKDLSLGLISPKIYFAENYEYHKDRYKSGEKGKVIWYAGGIIDWKNIICSHRGVDLVDQKQYEQAELTDFSTGCAMLIKKELIEKIGLLDKKYYMYFEDVDYSVRAKKAGFRILYQSKSFIWHKNASSSGKPGSVFHNYYLARNRLYFGFKYASNHTKLALFKDSLRLYRRDLSGERKGIMDYYLCRMGRGDFI